MELTVVVPTFNEAPNVAELVARTATALEGVDAEILFIDDSTDATPDVIAEVARTAPLPVRVLHRDDPQGGLAGAVIAGLEAAHADAVAVMDGDLQHPPEELAALYRRFAEGGVDVVVASRYAGDGDARGLSDRTRVAVSWMSTTLTKSMFPKRLKDVTDPMTGFFLVDRRRVAVDRLRPRGFKILLEILARHPLRVTEVPFQFAARQAGSSKASLREGMRFLSQLAALRFGKMSLFALIGAAGAVANVGIVWGLTALGVGDLAAMIIAAEATIIGNFLLQEHFVFHDMRGEASGVWSRFAKSFSFNNAEALVRIPITALLVSSWHISVVIATALTLTVAFVARFVFHSLVVYAPRKTRAAAPAARTAAAPDYRIVTPTSEST